MSAPAPRHLLADERAIVVSAPRCEPFLREVQMIAKLVEGGLGGDDGTAAPVAASPILQAKAKDIQNINWVELSGFCRPVLCCPEGTPVFSGQAVWKSRKIWGPSFVDSSIGFSFQLPPGEAYLSKHKIRDLRIGKHDNGLLAGRSDSVNIEGAGIP